MNLQSSFRGSQWQALGNRHVSHNQTWIKIVYPKPCKELKRLRDISLGLSLTNFNLAGFSL